MTREEAIQFWSVRSQYLHKWIDENVEEASAFLDYLEAVDMAISALQEEKDGIIRYKLSKPIEYIELDYTNKEVTKLSYDSNITLVTPKGEQKNEYNNITESPNDVIEKNDEVIKSVRCKDCEWFDNCESFVTPPCTKQTEPSDKGGDAEMRNDRTYTNAPYMQETPSEDGSDLISREDLLKKAEKGNITKYSTNSVNIITTDVVTVENIKKAPSADTPTTEVKKPTNTPTDLISRADAVAYPLGFDHYDKENGSRKFISGVESYREYVQHLPSVSVEKATENKYDCDLISRAKVLNVVQNADDGNIPYEVIKDIIQGLPSVSAEPTTRERKETKRTLLTLKHLFEDEQILNALDVAIECVSAERVGVWKEVEDYNGDIHYQCSQCGEEWVFPYGTPNDNNANYCPNCGARMVKESEE